LRPSNGQQGQQPTQQQHTQPGGSLALYRQQFAAAAGQHPERLLPWRTNRVLIGRRLAWLAPGQQPPARCRHLGTAAVLAYCRSRGRHVGGDSDSDSSSGEGSDSDGGGAGGLSRRLRFWQL